MFSFLRKCVIPAVVAAGMVGFATMPFARADDKPAAADEVKKGTISGTVVDKDGKPVSGAMVGVMKPGQGRPGGRGGANGGNNGGAVKQATEDPKPAPAPEPGRGGRRPEPLFKATTDADGKFTIKDVPAGDYAVMARVEGKGMARERVTVKEGETASVSLKLADRPARGGAGQAAGAGANRPNRRGGAAQ